MDTSTQTRPEDKILEGVPIPTAGDVVELLHAFTSLVGADTPEEHEQISSLTYKYTHIADIAQDGSSCLHAHKDWVEDFWRHQQGMIDAGEIQPRDADGNRPARKNQVV
jgi:hypothetical protein